MTEVPTAPARWKVHARSNGLLLARLAGVLLLLYLFIISIHLLGDSFKMAGKGFAAQVLSVTDNPLVGLLIGLLATAIIQSSSTTTSLIVTLAASGSLPFQAAIPMVMGANIGTSVTNTLVSMAHITHSDEFKRAFAGSTVHDFFNLCSVIVLLPLQVAFNIIGRSSRAVESLFEGFGGIKISSPLAAITKPVAKDLLHLLGDSPLVSGIVAVILLFIALRYIVKLLKSMVLARVERFFQRYIFRTPVLGFILGIALTVLVQSSSITTSLVVPLLGAGVLTIHQIFPYTLGANIGTTVTAFLAALATGSPAAISVAFAHLLFNVYGTAIFWPLKRIPIFLAETLSGWSQRSKLIPVAYVLIVFFLLPGSIIFLMR